MPALRARFTPRHSTAALLGVGLAAGVIGAVLGQRLRPAKPAGISPPVSNVAAPSMGAAVSSELDFDLIRRQQDGLPPSALRDEALADALSTLARHAPRRAVACALAERNSLLRQILLAAALRGWASVGADPAADWVLQRPLGERGTDIAAVMEAAAQDPAEALRLAARLIRADPALAHDHGCSLILGLARRGDFADAAAFAAEGTPDQRAAWLATAFAVWTEHAPSTAADAALALPDATARENAASTVFARWATLDPRGLAEYSVALPPEAGRHTALAVALPEWANQDLAAASAWINQQEPSAEFDTGVVAVATQTPLIARQPEIAVSWAESVFDVELRSRTLAVVMKTWARLDSGAARRYAENSAAVNSADRPLLLASANSPGGD